MTQRVVINECFGGFGLSGEATTMLRALAPDVDPHDWKDQRDDARLVRVVEQLGDEASDRFSALHIAEIPDGIKWAIGDYDGWERVHEQHRVWNSSGEEL